MGARSYTLLITKQLIINQLDRDKGKGASGAGEAPVRWRRTRAIRSRRRPSPYTFLTTTLHHPTLAKLPHIGTRLEALPSLPRCATGQIGPWRTATIGTAHRMAIPVRLFGGAPRRFLHSLPLGRNDKMHRSVDPVPAGSGTRERASR